MNQIYNKIGSKIGWFEYIYFLMIVIYAGMAIPFTRSMSYNNEEPIGFILPIIMTLILLAKNKVTFNNNYLFLVIFIYTSWSFIQYIKYNQFNLSLSFFTYYNIIIAYIIINVYKTTIFGLYEKIVTQLSIVAIVGWLLMIFIPNIFGGIIDMIKMPNSGDDILRGNILIFSMTNLDVYKSDELWGLTRNSGFSWEPGRFSAMLVIALFFNLARNQFKFSENRGFWILLFALLTTQSTTGFMSLAILVILFLLNKNTDRKIFYLAIFIPLAIFITSLPFMGEKISSLLDNETTSSKIEEDLSIMDKYNVDGGYVPQRFDGLAFEVLNIINDPILGYGQDVGNSFVRSNISNQLILSNGILSVFSRFGLIIGAIFYFLLYKSSKWISTFYNIKGGIILMLLYMSISISYDFVLITFFLAISMFSIFVDPNLKITKSETEILNKKLLINNMYS